MGSIYVHHHSAGWYTKTGPTPPLEYITIKIDLLDSFSFVLTDMKAKYGTRKCQLPDLCPTMWRKSVNTTVFHPYVQCLF